jgi:hypothetical protein
MTRWGSPTGAHGAVTQHDLFTKFGEDVLQSDNHKDACQKIQVEFEQMLDMKVATRLLSLQSRKHYYKLLRRRIFDINPKMNREDLPKCPGDIYTKVQKQESDRLAEKLEHPIELNGDLMISLLENGLRDGIDRKQHPQVVFCMNWLLGTRANDLNVAFSRVNGDIASKDDYQIVKSAGICGTLINSLVSKSSARPQIEEYATVFISEKYELMSESIKFIFDPTITRLPCI